MKNILFVGPYRQSDGWGNAAKEYLRSLRLTGYDISSRPIYLNNQKEYTEYKEFNDLEDNSKENYDIIIQNVLPNMFRNYGNSKHIGLAFFESSINHTPWPASIDIMDEMWVSSSFEDEIIKGCSNTKTNVIPIPTNIEKFSEDSPHKKLLEDHKHEFKFYFIGENITRKNIRALIIAFHREFLPSEQVRLVLKVNNVGQSESQTLNSITNYINDIKLEMGMYPDISDYKSELV